jgi:hypothetical protein
LFGDACFNVSPNKYLKDCYLSKKKKKFERLFDYLVKYFIQCYWPQNTFFS